MWRRVWPVAFLWRTRPSKLTSLTQVTLLCTDSTGALWTAAAKLGVMAKPIAVGYDGRVSEAQTAAGSPQ